MPEPDLSGVSVRVSALGGGWLLISVEAKDVPGDFLNTDSSPRIMLRINGGKAFVPVEASHNESKHATKM